MTGAQNQTTRSLIGVIAAMAVVNLVYGITFPLMALVLDGQGVSKTLIGLSTMSQAASIFAIAPLAPRLLTRFEPARIMQISAAILVVLFVLAGLRQDVWLWFPLRFVMGALNALLWISSEALINELSEERYRARVVGVYSSVGAAGFAVGPLLLILTGSEGLTPFLATAGLVGLSALPLFLVEPVRSSYADEAPVGLWKVFTLAPVIMLGNLFYAAVAESNITFFPIFGMHLGLSEAYSLTMLTVVAVGSMVLILPLGWLADHVSRMGMMAACVFLSILGLLVMPWMMTESPGWMLATFMFSWGGVEGMVYALGVALVGQRFRGAALAAASTAFTACWGMGTIIGPMVSGVGMDTLGEGSLAWIGAAFFALFLPLPVVAWLRERRGHEVNKID